MYLTRSGVASASGKVSSCLMDIVSDEYGVNVKFTESESTYGSAPS